MSDDHGPSSDPFGSPESESGERGMTFFGATAWALSTYLGLQFLAGIVVTLRHPASVDITTLVGVQTVVTLLVLFAILRFYAPNISVRHFLGLRPTHFAFYPLAGLLGALAHVPVNALLHAIEKYYPTDPESERYMFEQLDVSTPHRIAVGIAIVLVGPLVEEVFFRGALVRPLRKNASAWSVVALTSCLFALAHGEWQKILPIALLGMALGLLRISSGSLVPGAIMHATFNAVTLWAMLTSDPAAQETGEPFPFHVAIAGTLFTLVLLGVAYLVGERSRAALEARSEDEA